MQDKESLPTCILNLELRDGFSRFLPQTLNSFVGETFATMYDMFDKSSKAAKAPLIYDEGARTIYDKAKANTLKDQDIQDFMGMATQQFPAMYGGGIGGLYAFRDQFYGYTDPRTGQKFDPKPQAGCPRPRR